VEERARAGRDGAAGLGALTGTVLVLGAGPAQLGLLEAARAARLYVIAADRDPEAVGFAFADERALASVEDEQEVLRLADARRPDGIIAPGTDFPVLVAARVAARLGLPHPIDPATALAATSKSVERDRFAAGGVPEPGWRTCRTLAEAQQAIEAFGLPCVVKPPDRQGQRGLSLVHEADTLEGAFDRALEAARGDVVLVEELVEGSELTVNAFSVEGEFHPLTVTDRVRAEPPAFGVALAHVWPSELPDSVIAAVVDAARAAAEAVGVRNGPTYTQVLAGTKGPRVAELAARLGGGHDAELCEAALGVDLNRLALAAALGEPVGEGDLRPRSDAGGACVRFLVPPVGTLQAIEGLDEAASLEGVRWVRVYRRPGFELRELHTGPDRAGAALAVGTSRHEAFARAGAALERVRLVTARGGGRE
jgi:biotin carboxylase